MDWRKERRSVLQSLRETSLSSKCEVLWNAPAVSLPPSYPPFFWPENPEDAKPYQATSTVCRLRSPTSAPVLSSLFTGTDTVLQVKQALKEVRLRKMMMADRDVLEDAEDSLLQLANTLEDRY